MGAAASARRASRPPSGGGSSSSSTSSSRGSTPLASHAAAPCKHTDDVVWASRHGIRTVQTALVEARAIAAQLRAEAEAAARAEAEAEAARVAQEMQEARAAGAKSSKLRAITTRRRRAPSPLDAAPAERRAAALVDVEPLQPEPEPEPQPQPQPQPERADYRVLCDAPVLDAMSHSATKVGSLGAKDLIEEVALQLDDSGGEWVHFEGHQTTGWVSVLAQDGRTLQLGRDYFRKRRQTKRAVKRAVLARSSTSMALASTRSIAEEKEFQRSREAARAAGEDEPQAEGEATCLLMMGDGRTFRRAQEIGEWYAATGCAVELKGWDHYYKLLDGACGPDGVPVYEIPEPEPEAEPEIDLKEYMRRESSQAGLKFSDSNSGIAQKRAAFRSTEDTVAAAVAKGWWECDLGPCASGFDNGCPNVRSIQEATLKEVNAKAGDVILEVGFFLGEAMAKTASALAAAAAACDLIEPGRARIKSAEERVQACGVMLDTAKDAATKAAIVAAKDAKAAAEHAAAKAEEERLRREAKEAELEGASPMEVLKILAAEAEEAQSAAAAAAAAKAAGGQSGQEREPTLAEIAASSANASAAAGEVSSAAAAEMHKAAEDLDRQCIIGGGVGRVHGCELEGRIDALCDYLSNVLPPEAADVAQSCAADVPTGTSSDSGLPFPSQVFDKVYSIGALPFWPNLPAALAELRRVLDPQGILVLALQCSLVAAGQWGGKIPSGLPWNERDIVQALREAGFGVEVAKRFTLDEYTNAQDQDEATHNEKRERLELAQQQQRAASDRNLKAVPDATIEYIGAPCYRTVYCTTCRGFIGSGKPLYQPAGKDPPPKAEPAYTLSFGPTSCECLLPMLDDVEIDELQLDVIHPWSPDAIVTHTFGKQEFPPVDLENHHSPPVLELDFTAAQTENLMKALSTNKRAMHVTVKVYAAELDYKGDVTTRTLLGVGIVDLGAYLLDKATNKVTQPQGGEGEGEGEDEGGVRSEQVDRHHTFKVVVESTTASREPIAKVDIDFRADAVGWSAAYIRRLRTIYYPAHEQVNICRDCYRMATLFASQRAAIAKRWEQKHRQVHEVAAATEENKGSAGVSLDYVILVAGPLDGRFSAARCLDEASLLSDNFITHFEGS
jgi:SAM-dependent methyltransferase